MNKIKDILWHQFFSIFCRFLSSWLDGVPLHWPHRKHTTTTSKWTAAAAGTRPFLVRARKVHFNGWQVWSSGFKWMEQWFVFLWVFFLSVTQNLFVDSIYIFFICNLFCLDMVFHVKHMHMVCLVYIYI